MKETYMVILQHRGRICRDFIRNQYTPQNFTQISEDQANNYTISIH